MPLETYLGVGAGAGIDTVGGWLALALKQMAGMAGAGVALRCWGTSGVKMAGGTNAGDIPSGWGWCWH